MYSVYLAGPFFNDQQLATIKKLEDFLEKEGFDVFSPRKAGVLGDDFNTPGVRRQIFESNVEHIIKSEIMIAVIDDRDTGTIWEMGCRYGLWATRYGYQQVLGEDLAPLDSQRHDCPMIISYTDHDYGVNVMLSESVICHCKGLEELKIYLDKIKMSNPSRVERDTESTERLKVF